MVGHEFGHAIDSNTPGGQSGNGVSEANRECRVCSASRDGNRDVTLSMDRGSDEVAVRRFVRCVEQDATLLRFAPDRGMKSSFFDGLECGDRDVCAIEIAVAVRALVQRDRTFCRELLEAPRWNGRDDRHPRAAVEEPADLRFGQRTTTNHDGEAAAEVEGNRIVVRAG